MPKVIIYTKDYCPYCYRAKDLLDNKKVSYTEFDVTHDPEKEQEMRERSQRTTVPQIFIDDTHVGGCDDLFALDKSGELDKLLVS
jgi:glutaredoxin 3